MDCRSCKHWNGTKHSVWGDCGQWIFTVDAMNHTDRFGNRCAPPFDPHDLQYYLSTSEIWGSMDFVNHSYGRSGFVRVTNIKEIVKWMDDHGVQTTQKRSIPYIQTRKDSHCERYEAR